MRNPRITIPNFVIQRNRFNRNKSPIGYNWSPLCNAESVDVKKQVLRAHPINFICKALVFNTLAKDLSSEMQVGVEFLRDQVVVWAGH